MEYDEAKVAEMVLALMFLGRHGSKVGTRTWKGFDWEAMDRLFEQGMISDPKGKARSVILTEEGKARSEELFGKHFAIRSDQKVGGLDWPLMAKDVTHNPGECMRTTVRVADPADLAFVSQDGYVPDALVARKIEHREVIVSEIDGVPVGYAHIEYLWSQRPYLSVIHVTEQHRRQGVGKRMLMYLGEMLKASGYSTLLSSSQVDEPEPQTWHRRMGFRECGIINGVNDGGVGEVFFTKGL